jgi:hypothetical protein
MVVDKPETMILAQSPKFFQLCPSCIVNVHTKSTTVWPGLNSLCFSLSCGA